VPKQWDYRTVDNWMKHKKGRGHLNKTFINILSHSYHNVVKTFAYQILAVFSVIK